MIDTLNEMTERVMNSFSGGKKPVIRFFLISERIKAAIIYIDEMTDSESVNRDIMKPLLEAKINSEKSIIKNLCESFIPFGEAEIESDINKSAELILNGCVLLFTENSTDYLSLSARKWSKRGIDEPPNESVIRGPREGFVEDIKSNVSLLRRRLKTPDIVFEMLKVGRYSGTKVAVVYVSSIADKGIVVDVLNKIKAIDIDGILDAEYVAAFLKGKKAEYFPTVGLTEKPDIAAGKLLEGRVCIIVDGSPSVITLPFLFIENFQDSGDYYSMTFRKNILRVLRLVSFLFAVLLPGLFTAMLLFHYEMLPTDILLTIVNARDGIPMNPMLELIVTMFLFELLQEASIRMPRHLGSAMSIVGALILGDTAVKSGAISSPAVMICAVSAIAIYNVPDLSDIINILRFGFTILGGFIGFFGIMLGSAFVIIYLTSLESFGMPYLAPYAPLFGNDKQDAILITPVTKRYFRPFSIPTDNRVRLKTKKNS